MKAIEKTFFRWVDSSKVSHDNSNAVVTLDNGSKLVYCLIEEYSGSGINTETGNFTEPKGGFNITPLSMSDL